MFLFLRRADAQTLVTKPISLICICTKILEHIVYSSISKHLQSYDVLCDVQHGFRPNRSCNTQPTITLNDFAECLNKGGQCDVLALDFSKAFNKFHMPVYISNCLTMEYMGLYCHGFRLFN